MILYDYYRSTASYRVRIALNLKQITHQLHPINLIKNEGEQHTESYVAINPQHLVPSLNDNGNIITQSLAIIHYLEDLYPDPPLWPKPILAKAYINSLALMIVADVHPLNNLRVLQYLKNKLHVTEEAKLAWYHEWLELGLTALEQKIQAASFMGDFCLGNTPTIADVCLVPQLYNARRYQLDLQSFPTLLRIEANCQKLPAFAAAKPKGDTHEN